MMQPKGPAGTCARCVPGGMPPKSSIPLYLARSCSKRLQLLLLMPFGSLSVRQSNNWLDRFSINAEGQSLGLEVLSTHSINHRLKSNYWGFVADPVVSNRMPSGHERWNPSTVYCWVRKGDRGPTQGQLAQQERKPRVRLASGLIR